MDSITQYKKQIAELQEKLKLQESIVARYSRAKNCLENHFDKRDGITIKCLSNYSIEISMSPFCVMKKSFVARIIISFDTTKLTGTYLHGEYSIENHTTKYDVKDHDFKRVSIIVTKFLELLNAIENFIDNISLYIAHVHELDNQIAPTTHQTKYRSIHSNPFGNYKC